MENLDLKELTEGIVYNDHDSIDVDISNTEMMRILDSKFDQSHLLRISEFFLKTQVIEEKLLYTRLLTIAGIAEGDCFKKYPNPKNKFTLSTFKASLFNLGYEIGDNYLKAWMYQGAFIYCDDDRIITVSNSNYLRDIVKRGYSDASEYIYVIFPFSEIRKMEVDEEDGNKLY